MMHVHRLLSYSIDLIRSAGVDVVFVVGLIDLCVPCQMAIVSLSPPAFVVVYRPPVISSKCRARISIALLFQLLMDFELRAIFKFVSGSVGVREQLPVNVFNKFT